MPDSGGDLPARPRQVRFSVSPERQGGLFRVLSGGLIVASLIATTLAFWAATKRCDDGCVAEEFATSWTETKDAGEWTGQFALSLAGFGLLLAFLYLRTRKPQAAWMMLVLSIACYASWTAWFLTW